MKMPLVLLVPLLQTTLHIMTTTTTTTQLESKLPSTVLALIEDVLSWMNVNVVADSLAYSGADGRRSGIL